MDFFIYILDGFRVSPFQREQVRGGRRVAGLGVEQLVIAVRVVILVVVVTIIIGIAPLV